MNTEGLSCWRCGASLAAFSLPLRRLEECPSCRSELHVCRLCRAYDPRLPRKCREDDAEEVKNKEQANFCDYFKPRPGAYDAASAAIEKAAQDRLSALFGGTDEGSGSAFQGSSADSLFRRNSGDAD